ncbi:MAG: DEAD/DEAH box helicase [Eubacteriales bacterium]|nr:DEAD/DEAH box helicase [Eubacteriales bacterium]MDD3349226.1 DEAD/DEAH box helicase [Eubacteriales bacterium]
MELTKFEEMNLSPELMRAIQKEGFETATSVQTETIPAMLEWKDIIAKAPTGTGKTFAFGIPIIEHIDPEDSRVQALILAPTRELALQICAEIRMLSQFKPGIKAATIYGGQSIDLQIQALKQHPKILVATPGRLLDHLGRRTIKLDGIKTVVLDEADRMVDLGFYKDVTKILDLMPHRKNLALLSATISREVMDIGWVYQRDAVEVTVLEDTENKPDIFQYSLKISESRKIEAMMQIMKNENYGRAMVFCNTKHKVIRVSNWLNDKGFSADCIHGDVRQNIREKVLKTFRNGNLSILVATDVAARGIDVDDVDAVFNYDIPLENEYYTHRIGRTGRAKKHGASYTFITNMADEIRLEQIAKFTKSLVSPITLGE